MAQRRAVMRRLGCHLVLLTALAAPRLGAQAKAPPPTEGHQAFSVREAPENLVYRFFLQELVGSQRAADERRDQGKDDAGLRYLYQRRLRLDASDYQMLVSATQASVAALDANRRTRKELVEELKQTPDKTAAGARLKQLAQADDAAVADGVGQVRLSLGPERFAQLDWLIRLHVVPNLKVVPASPRRTAVTGGK